MAKGIDPTRDPLATHCDPIEPTCVFDVTSWEDGAQFGVDGPVLLCQTHRLLAPSEIYEQAFPEGS